MESWNVSPLFDEIIDLAVLYYCKWNIFGSWAFCWTQQATENQQGACDGHFFTFLTLCRRFIETIVDIRVDNENGRSTKSKHLLCSSCYMFDVTNGKPLNGVLLYCISIFSLISSRVLTFAWQCCLDCKLVHSSLVRFHVSRSPHLQGILAHCWHCFRY